MIKIASIHQPQPLPWMGLMNKILSSDVFVWYDTALYRTRHYHNRTKIKRDDRSVWLTLPVHGDTSTPIGEVGIADPKWKERFCKTIEHSYGKTAHFRDSWPRIEESIVSSPDTLSGANLSMLKGLLEVLGEADVEIVVASSLGVQEEDATERLVSLCKAVGASAYLSGRGGRNYMETERFDRAGIELLLQDFDFAEVTYEQKGQGFLPGLSVLDCLFNVGIAETRRLCKESWRPERKDSD